MPQNWYPRYYPAFKYLGLPSGTNCLTVIQVKSGSETKRKIKKVSSETADNVTSRVLETGRKAVRVAANQRLQPTNSRGSTNSSAGKRTKELKDDAENLRLDRIENAKNLIAMQNSTRLAAWGMNSDRLEKLKSCAKEDMENPESDDDKNDLRQKYNDAKAAYRLHIDAPFVMEEYVPEIEPQTVAGIDRLIAFDEKLVDTNENDARVINVVVNDVANLNNQVSDDDGSCCVECNKCLTFTGSYQIELFDDDNEMNRICSLCYPIWRT